METTLASFLLSAHRPQVIWLAAHMDRSLKRQQVFETNIVRSVDTMLKPQGPGEAEPPLALRLSGQLMLGVVKVYARKVQYLQQVS
jgi:cohesin complex subunit SCC1